MTKNSLLSLLVATVALTLTPGVAAATAAKDTSKTQTSRYCQSKRPVAHVALPGYRLPCSSDARRQG